MTDINACNNSDTVIINVVPDLNIDLTQNYNLFCKFPNPTTGLINIRFSIVHSEDIVIKLFNQEGEEIRNNNICVEITGGTLLFDLSSLPSGMYYIEVLTDMEFFIGKVVLQVK